MTSGSPQKDQIIGNSLLGRQARKKRHKSHTAKGYRMKRHEIQNQQAFLPPSRPPVNAAALFMIQSNPHLQLMVNNSPMVDASKAIGKAKPTRNYQTKKRRQALNLATHSENR